MKNLKAILSILFTAFVVVSPTIAFAHAFLDHAEPKVGSTVAACDSEVKVWFTEAIEPAFSKLEVYDANDQRVDLKKTHIDEHDNKLLIANIPALASGQYKVVWSVVAADTHHTHGDFKFTVAAKG